MVDFWHFFAICILYLYFVFVFLYFCIFVFLSFFLFIFFYFCLVVFVVFLYCGGQKETRPPAAPPAHDSLNPPLLLSRNSPFPGSSRALGVLILVGVPSDIWWHVLDLCPLLKSSCPPLRQAQPLTGPTVVHGPPTTARGCSSHPPLPTVLTYRETLIAKPDQISAAVLQCFKFKDKRIKSLHFFHILPFGF